jgi:hypothetical protein
MEQTMPDHIRGGTLCTELNPHPERGFMLCQKARLLALWGHLPASKTGLKELHIIVHDGPSKPHGEENCWCAPPIEHEDENVRIYRHRSTQ